MSYDRITFIYAMDLNIKNKVAIVCGSSKGIGFAIAQELVNEGVFVMLNSRSEIEAKNAVQELNASYNSMADYTCGDLAEYATCEKIVNSTLDKWGSIDILVNNTGGPPPKNFLNTSEADWEKCFQNVLMSPIRLTKLVSPYMIKNNWGRIITIGSTLMKEPSGEMVLSATMRSAIVSYMKSISYILAPYNITVNTISTGGVSTDRLTSLFNQIASNEGVDLNQKLSEAASSIPLKRFATPKEFVQGIIFLASTNASYITGECLAIDGGLTRSAF